MRLAIVVAPEIGVVHGMVGNITDLRKRILDRQNETDWHGAGFPGEVAVRIPRRLARTDHDIWAWFHGRGIA